MPMLYQFCILEKKHVDTFPLGVSVTNTQHMFEELSILRNKISNL